MNFTIASAPRCFIAIQDMSNNVEHVGDIILMVEEELRRVRSPAQVDC